MHLPPAAQASLGRSRSQLCFLLAWTGVYAILLGAVYGAITPPAFAGLTLTSLVVLAHCTRRWWTSPVGLLAWTGRGWIWQQAQGQQSCSVRWCVDLQSFVLLELQMQQGQRQWLWVERGAHSVASWRAFRRALVAANNTLAEEGEGETDFFGRAI